MVNNYTIIINWFQITIIKVSFICNLNNTYTYSYGPVIIGDGHRVASKQNKPTVQNINVIYDIIHESWIHCFCFHDLTKIKSVWKCTEFGRTNSIFHRVFGRKINWFYFLVTLKWTSGFAIHLSFFSFTIQTTLQFLTILKPTHTHTQEIIYFNFIFSHLLMKHKKKNRKVNEWDFWIVGLVFSLLQMTFNLAHIALSWSLIRQHTLYRYFVVVVALICVSEEKEMKAPQKRNARNINHHKV